MASRNKRLEHLRQALLAIWLAFAVSSTLWVPIYRGEGGGEGLIVLYVPVAAGVAFWVRERAPSVAAAVVSALPNILFAALAAIAGEMQNESDDGQFGEPLYLYFGVALLGSWVVLVFVTAAASRTRWNRMAGLLLGLAVAVAGYGLITFQVN